MKAVSIKATKAITHVIIEDDMYSENDLLRPAEVSKLVGFSEKALANRRNRRLDPPWFRPPGSNRILYRRGDVIAWINAGRRDPMGGRQDG